MKDVLRWRDVPGEIEIELQLTNTGIREWGGNLLDAQVNIQLLKALQDPTVKFDTSYMRLDIEFRSSGYDDPGRTWGCPDDCYPPSQDEERTLEEVTLFVELSENMIPVPLDKKTQAIIFDTFQSLVNDIDINPYED